MTDLPAADSRRLRRLASGTSLVFALVLVGVKLAGWLLTGSVALLTSAVDAGLDVLASAVTFIGIRFAERPADREHRYGHGKGETLAAFVQALLLASAGLVLLIQSVERLVTPEPLEAIGTGLWLIGGSLLAAIALVALQSWVLARAPSHAIAADRVHYLTDIVVNLAVLAALGLTGLTGWTRIDPGFASAISIYMMWCARGILLEALRPLLDQELPAADRDAILGTLRACPGVRNAHDLRTRDAGDRIFIECHLEVDGALTITVGHAISHAAETAVLRLYPNAEVITHLEPAGIQDERLDDKVAAAEATGPDGR
jgi:ferrous-iron efflux pump FieF